MKIDIKIFKVTLKLKLNNVILIMIIPDLDRKLLYFLKKEDIKVFSLLSKYHNKLTQEDFYPLCYHLLRDKEYKIFIYNDTTLTLKKKNTISLMKNDNNCISFNKSPKMLLAKI